MIEFEWKDLPFEPIGDDAVVVVGKFTGRLEGGSSTTFSYAALLRRVKEPIEKDVRWM